MLLRLQTKRIWRRFFYFFIGALIVLATYNMLAYLLRCIPIHALWDLLGVVKDKKCWSTTAVRAHIISISTVNIATDFILAAMPITFLRNIQRPLRERVIVGILMALGVCAGVASIVKIYTATQIGRTGDVQVEGIKVGMWSLVEELLGFIAACVPCLRSQFQRVLRHFGLVSTQGKSTHSQGYAQMYGARAHSKSQSKSGIKMKTLRVASADARSEENILREGSNDDIKRVEIWCTTELRMERGLSGIDTEERVGPGAS